MIEYQNLLRHVLAHGKFKTDRTGTGTYSVFGAQARFDLRSGFVSDDDSVGKSARFKSVYSMATDNLGNIFMACGSSVRRMDTATNVTTVAGRFTSTGYANGKGNFSLFNIASGICVAQGSLFVVDSTNQRIRQITFDAPTQFVSGASLSIGTYSGLNINGIVGRTYQIQSSPNMNTWTTTATVILNASPYLWIDQNPVSGNKFYRALLLP